MISSYYANNLKVSLETSFVRKNGLLAAVMSRYGNECSQYLVQGHSSANEEAIYHEIELQHFNRSLPVFRSSDLASGVKTKQLSSLIFPGSTVEIMTDYEGPN